MRRGVSLYLRFLRFVPIAAGLVLFPTVSVATSASAYAVGGAPSTARVEASRAVYATNLVVTGSGALVKVAGGLFLSQDGGRRWHALPVRQTLHPEKLRWIAAVPGTPSRLYAAGPGAGVLRSDDGGHTWHSAGSGPPTKNMGAFAAHSYLPDTLYAWISGKGVYRSQFGGTDWKKMDSGPAAQIDALTHSTLPGSMNTGWLYAASPKGIYLSMDCF